MTTQVEKVTERVQVQLPDLRAYRRSTHYAPSPELKALYAESCQSCGMCCVYYAGGPFRMPIAAQGQQPPKRFIQIGKRVRQWTREESVKIEAGETSIGTAKRFGAETTAYLRIKPDTTWKGFNRCVALKGTQGVKVSCGIYDSRPYACSDYEPGSPECFKVRQWAGLEPIDDGYGHS